MTHVGMGLPRKAHEGEAVTSVRRCLGACGLIVVVALFLFLVASVASPQVEAATWHTKLSASGHHDHTYGPVTLRGGRETRLKYWTARISDADDDDEGGEWEYDWVKFRLIRSDTGRTIKTFGPYYSPTGYLNWKIASVKLPSGRHPYKLRVTCDDARWGFKLQQKS